MKTKYKIGDILEGKVTGVQSYGVFVQLDDDSQGLVHISECKHGYITNIDHFIKVGEMIRVIVIDVDEYSQKISLSIRALEPLNYPPFPAKTKNRKRYNKSNIGFSTLERALPKMIENGLNDIEYDEYHIPT